MKKGVLKTISLQRETLQSLTSGDAAKAAAGSGVITNCSVCVSCVDGTSCTC